MLPKILLLRWILLSTVIGSAFTIIERPTHADDTYLFNEVCGDQRIANCGVYTTAFLMKYYQKKFDMEELAKALGTTRAWDQAVDMMHMKSALSNAGLSVTGYEKTKIEEIVSQLEKTKDGSAILYQKGLPGRVGHYFILLGGRKGCAFCVNISSGAMAWLTVDALQKEYQDAFSGVCLIISTDSSVSQSNFILDGSDITLDKGEIAVGGGILDASMQLTNPTGTDVQLAATKGGCVCFKGAVVKGGDGKTIPAHATREVVLSFDRTLLGPGAVSRDILLSFAGFPQEWIKFTLKGHMAYFAPNIQLTWYPEAIDVGTVTDPKKLDPQEITFFVPKGTTLNEPKSSSKHVKIEALASNATDNLGREIKKFSVTLDGQQAGEMHETLTFSSSDDHFKEIVVLISGEFRP